MGRSAEKKRRESKSSNNVVSESVDNLSTAGMMIENYRKIKMSEIMTMYKPKILVYLGFIVSLIVSL